MVGWLFGSFVVLLLIGTPIAASLGLAAVITIVMSGCASTWWSSARRCLPA